MITLTITGADDDVDPGMLLFFARQHRWLEFGILVSASRQGSPRYPSLAWRQRLLDVAVGARGMRLSYHLCGSAMRETISGSFRWLPPIEIVQRVQLNGYEPTNREAYSRLRECNDMCFVQDPLDRFKGLPPFDWILQARSAMSIARYADDAHMIGNACVLFDASGGRGVPIAPSTFHDAKKDMSKSDPHNVRLGFAGGIALDTIDAAYCAVQNYPGAWIDLETGARDDLDRFDLRRVEDLIRRFAEFRRNAEFPLMTIR